MKIAIHKEGTWNKKIAQFCLEEGIEYKILDFLHTDIIEQLNGVTHVFWLYHHASPNDIEFATKILSSIERKNIKVFPNYHTRFHFDDKVAQKYLFESLKIDTPKAWVFYDEKIALSWAHSGIKIPIVAKLKGGAGSYNVKLIKTKRELRSYIKKSFRKGIKNYPSITKNLIHKTRQTGKSHGLKGILSRASRIPNYLNTYSARKRYSPVDIGYAYFQEFIPNNDHDIRVSIVGNKAWAFTRYVRENDFRASGSGNASFDRALVPATLINKSFETADSLKMQSCCFDWVYNEKDNSFKLIEVSMGFDDEYILKCGGYYDRKIEWHNKPTSACEEVFKRLLEENDNVEVDR